MSALHAGAAVIAPLVSDTAWEELAEFARARPEELILPLCGHQCFPRTSHREVKHFVHRAGSECGSYAGESEDHRLAKTVLARAVASAGWNVALEHPHPKHGFIADVLAWQGGRVVAFEVQLAHQTLTQFLQQTARYTAAGVELVWFASQQVRGQVPAHMYVLDCVALTATAHGEPTSSARPLDQVVIEHLTRPPEPQATIIGDTEGTVCGVWTHRCRRCRRPMTVWAPTDGSTFRALNPQVRDRLRTDLAARGIDVPALAECSPAGEIDCPHCHTPVSTRVLTISRTYPIANQLLARIPLA